MTKRLFTRLVPLLLGMFLTVLAQSQNVSFAASPSTVSPNVGDTVRINFVVTNFTRIVSFQYSADWDASLLKFIGIQNKNMPDAALLVANSPTGKPNCAIIAWNASSSVATVPDGQSIFQLVFVAQAASTNFWMKLGNTCTTAEVVQRDLSGNDAPVKIKFSFLGVPPDANSQPITVATNTQSVANGLKVCEDVTTKTFTNILSGKWDMSWDATVLRFDSVSAFNATLGVTAANFTTSSSGTGTLNFNYTSATAKTLIDNSVLYRACFTAIGNGGTSTVVQTLTANSSVARSVPSIGQFNVGLTAQNGTVSISGGGTPNSVVTFTSNPATGNVGDNVCMNVSVKNFTNIANVNWSMHWDSTKISLVSASLKTGALGSETLTPPATISTPSNVFTTPANTTGTLTFLWQSANGLGVSIPDGSVMYEACFKLLATPGSAVTFDGKPLKFSVLDGDVKKVAGAALPATTNVTANAVVIVMPVNETSTLKNITCNGGGDGGITLAVSGGTGTYTYSWTGPKNFTSTLKDISTLSAGTYNVTITSGAATKTDVFTLTQPNVISPTGTSANSTCGNTPNGSINLVVTGGVAPYTFVWSSGEVTQNISNKGAGNYTVTITDSKNCAITPSQFTITSPPAISTTPTITNTLCKGSKDGAISIALNNGTSPYTFSWTGPSFTSSSQSITGLAAGSYALTVTDAKSCAYTTSYTVTEPTAIIIGAVNTTNANCNQQNGGATVAIPTGGTSPYTYAWTGGNNITQNSQNLTLVAAGTYTLTVQDANKCTATQNGVVVGNNASTLAIGTPTVTNATCGSSTGSITIAPTGGTAPLKFNWSGPVGFTATTQNISTLTAGSYAVTVTDAGNCNVVQSGIVVSNAASTLAVGTPTVKNVTCVGNNGSITIAPTGGTPPLKFVWTGPNGFTAATQSIANLAAGAYSVAISDANNCSVNSGIINITAAIAPTVALQTAKNLTCNNAGNGAITTTISGGTAPIAYSWTGPNGFTAATKDVSGLIAGAYTLNVNDASGCTTAPLLVTITQPDALAAGTQTAKNLTCNNAGNGSITTNVSGGTAPYSFAWTASNNFTGTTKDISNLAAGTYTLNVKDANNCSVAPIVVTLTQPATMSIAIQTVTPVGCKNAANGSIVMGSVSGGTAPYSYAWTGPSGFTSITKDITNLSAGSYMIIVTDANGCTTVPLIVNVTQPDGVVIGSPQITNVTCKSAANGSITETVSGGTPPYLYAWTGPNGFTSSALSVLNLSGGAYILRVSDAVGCTAVSNATITEPDSLKIISATATDITCNGNGNGGININVSGGTPNYSFGWSGPSFTSVQQNINNLKPGTYSVVVTDKYNCSTSASYTLKQPDSISIVYTTLSASGGCNGSAFLTVSGGSCNTSYVYTWSGQNVVSGIKDQSGNLCPGTYNLTVTDCRGCFNTKNILIGGSITGISILSTNVTPAGCVGDARGAISVTFTGGASPYTFDWYNKSNPALIISHDSAKISGLSAGTYIVRISDGIQKYVSGDIIVPGASTLLTVTLKSKQNETCNGNDGNIYIDVKDGLPPYSYQWNDGNTGKDRTGISAGAYSVVVRDQAFCIKESPQYTIGKDYCTLTFVTNVKRATCSDSQDGGISVSIQNGEPGYVIYWINNASGKKDSVRLDITQRSINYDIKNLVAGSYTVSIVDGKGQTRSSIIPVSGPDPIVITKTISPDPGNCVGSIILDVKGGTAPYTYSWNTGELTRDLFNLCAGSIRSVSVRDINNCTLQSSNDTIFLRQVVLEVKSANITNATCAGDSANTKIELIISGGAAPYSYVWTNNAGVVVSTNKDLVGVSAGKYRVVIKDSAKPIPQVITRDYTITTLSDLKLVDVTSVNVANPNDSTGTITVKVTGGKQPFTFTLSTGVTNSTGFFSGLAAGTYSVTLVDAQGCTDNRKDIPVNAATCATVAKNVNPAYNGYDLKCFGDVIGSATVKSFSGTLTAPYTFMWSSGEGGQTAFRLAAGSQTVKITDNKGKTCVVTIVMTSPDRLDLNLLSLNAQYGLDAAVTGGVSPYTYQWTTSGKDIAHSITGQKPGNYSVLVTDKNGCQVTGTATVSGTSVGCLDASRVLSPNNDGKNDNFRIDKCSYTTIKLEVFNRWGKQVYFNDNYINDSWKGHTGDGDSGSLLPEDIYFYILTGTDNVGQREVVKGTVNIMH